MQPGELGVVGGKGASLMRGYFDDVAASEASLNSDGWFLTGDLGMIDAKGYLCLTGRKKELIVRGGHNINPNFIEDLALRHAAVRLAAAVPVADDIPSRRRRFVALRYAGVLVVPYFYPANA